MEAYPGYRCSNCGRYSNMMGTGHIGKDLGWVCRRAQSEGLLPLDHYDLGPDLSVNFDGHSEHWERWRHDEGRLVKEEISEPEALELVWRHAPELRPRLKRPADLDERVLAAQATREEKALKAAHRQRPSSLAG